MLWRLWIYHKRKCCFTLFQILASISLFILLALGLKPLKFFQTVRNEKKIFESQEIFKSFQDFENIVTVYFAPKNVLSHVIVDKFSASFYFLTGFLAKIGKIFFLVKSQLDTSEIMKYMIWKRWIHVRRHWICAFIQIVLPSLLFLILPSLKLFPFFQNVSYQEQIFETQNVLNYSVFDRFQNSNLTVIFSPENQLSHDICQRLAIFAEFENSRKFGKAKLNI